MEYVLITGGTSGIGYELTRAFARHGFGIVIVSGNNHNLEKAKSNLQKEFSVDIELIEQDLTESGSAQKVFNRIQEMNINVTILINNAGIGIIGPADETGIQQVEKMLTLNIIALVELTKLFLSDMYLKKNGRILNVASTGAFQPGPYTAAYYASKAFVYNFSRAVRYEAKNKGVKVCVLCPGATKTNFFHRAGKNIPKYAMSAEKVASIAYKKLMQNKEVIVPGISNKLLRWLPIKIRMAGIAKIKNLREKDTMSDIQQRSELIKMILENESIAAEDDAVLHMLLRQNVSKNPIAENDNKLTVGQKAADKLAKFAGSWGFIISFFLILSAWIILNSVFLVKPYDVYPFILLNLILSCLAAVQAPIIMMSQNRQEEKDRLRAINDYKVNLKSEILIEDIHEKLDTIISNQKNIVERLDLLEKQND